MMIEELVRRLRNVFARLWIQRRKPRGITSAQVYFAIEPVLRHHYAKTTTAADKDGSK